MNYLSFEHTHTRYTHTKHLQKSIQACAVIEIKTMLKLIHFHRFLNIYINYISCLILFIYLFYIFNIHLHRFSWRERGDEINKRLEGIIVAQQPSNSHVLIKII